MRRVPGWLKYTGIAVVGVIVGAAIGDSGSKTKTTTVASTVSKGLASVLGLCLLIGAAGCGSSQSTSSQRTLSAHDQAALKEINSLTSSFLQLEREVGADTIAGSKIRSRSQYIRTEKPRIDKLNRTVQQLRLAVGSLDDTHLAALYTPLAEATDQEAGDLQLFLNTLIQGHVAALQGIYTRLEQDEHRIDNVALEQLPKVRAYARQYGG